MILRKKTFLKLLLLIYFPTSNSLKNLGTRHNIETKNIYQGIEDYTTENSHYLGVIMWATFRLSQSGLHTVVEERRCVLCWSEVYIYILSNYDLKPFWPDLSAIFCLEGLWPADMFHEEVKMIHGSIKTRIKSVSLTICDLVKPLEGIAFHELSCTWPHFCFFSKGGPSISVVYYDLHDKTPEYRGKFTMSIIWVWVYLEGFAKDLYL